MLASQRERPRTRFELAVEEIDSRPRDRRLRSVLHRAQRGGSGLHARALEHWGKGYATEIALALVDAAFFDLRAERVISTVDVNNGASIRVLEKIGMRWEAVFRKHRRAKNRWWDCHLFVLPREVWESSRATRERPLCAVAYSGAAFLVLVLGGLLARALVARFSTSWLGMPGTAAAAQRQQARRRSRRPRAR